MKNRKLLSVMSTFLLALILLAGAILLRPIRAEATAIDQGACGIGLTWIYDDTGILTVSGSGVMYDYGLYENAPWFDYRREITAIVIEDGITHIGNYAFYWFPSLTEVTMPDSVITIGANAFDDCDALTYAPIGNRVTHIGAGAFSSCSRITRVDIPDSVTTIGDYAFAYNSELNTVVIGSNVVSIGAEAFAWCTALSNVYIYDPSGWCNIVFGNDAANPMYYGLCMYVLDENGNSVTDIVLEPGVTAIPNYTFYGSAITSIAIPDSVVSVGRSAFNKCYQLHTVYYGGTESQWQTIHFDIYNELLTGARICHEHPAHDFTADATACSLCGYIRTNMEISAVVLKPARCGLYFKGAFTFGAHETVTRYGIAVSLYNELPVADDSDETSLYTVGENSVLISNILGEGKNGKALIYARPYVLLEDGTYIYGDVVVTNLKSVVETIDAAVFEGLSTVQQTALTDLYRQNTAAMQDWLIPKLKELINELL